MIVRKLLVTDGSSEQEVLLVGTLVVGRDPSCQLNNLDPLLSRRHAEFVCSNQGVTIRDLKSRNGILVNGNKVPEHALKPGDVIQLGHLHMQYVEESVVRSPEDSSRFHATTATGFELPTMAPASRPAVTRRPSAAATAPTATAPAPTEPASAAAKPPPTPPAASRASDESGIDVTVAPTVRQPAPARAPTPAAEADSDLTMAPTAGRGSADPPSTASVKAGRETADPDATRAPGPYAPAAVQDADTTIAPSSGPSSKPLTGLPSAPSFDETRAPAIRPHPAAAAAKSARPAEARVIANASLIITEASPSCPTVIGARPETLVGGQLADAISRSVRFVATGDGPSSLSLSITRAASGKTITVTFRAGQASENLS